MKTPGYDSEVLSRGAETHEVFNQSPPFEDVNLFTSDAPLVEAVARGDAGWAAEGLARLGAEAGGAHVMALGRLANENPPKLRRFDQKGFPLDKVEFHPAYHELMALSMREGLHVSAWEPLLTGGEARSGAQAARGARLYMMSQVECGHMCPTTMTHACVPALRANEPLLARLAPKLASRDYDPAFAPIPAKRSITIGMGMTEKQGGTRSINARSGMSTLNGSGVS